MFVIFQFVGVVRRPQVVEVAARSFCACSRRQWDGRVGMSGGQHIDPSITRKSGVDSVKDDLYAHVVRSMQQSRSKTDVLESLEKGEAWVSIDWAQSLLLLGFDCQPSDYREVQTSYFG